MAMLRAIRCRFGWHRTEFREDDTHFWRECQHCGRRSGLISREAVRRFAATLDRMAAYDARQANTLAEKPSPGGRS